MKTKYLTSLAMAALLLAACSDEQEFASTPSGEGVLRATVEGASPATRAGFDSEGAFYWTTGDQLGVTTTSSSTGFSALTLTSGAGQASGTFDGKISGELGSYAVYPYSASHSLNSTTLTYNFPATYNYTKVDADFFSATQGEGNSFNPAMWGSISNGSTQLKHLGGVFCIKIEKMPLTDGILTLTADKAITGTFTVDLSGETPALTSTATASENNAVSIDFESATLEASGVFYVPVPTGTYNVRIKVTDDSNTTPAEIDAAVGTYTVNRCDLKQITLTESSIDAEPADDLEAAVTDLGTHDNVTVSKQVSSTQSIEIPSTTGGAEVTKTLSLQDVASGASLTITDAAASTSENSVDNLVFSIPTNETKGYEPLDLTVTMPNTTVTLAGNGGKAAYGEVTASTAENTLILSSGVTVQKVIVNKGNIRVNSGAVLSAIERGDGNTAQVIIYKEEGATIPEGLDANTFVVKDVTIDELKSVFANGGEYVLNSDLSIIGENLTVPADKNVTLDLNGHTLTAANGQSSGIVVLGTFTLKDTQGTGVIKATKKYSDGGLTYSAGIIEVNGSKASMDMQGGNIEAALENATSNGQYGVGVWNGGTFTMTGGKIEAGWYAVSGNGTSSGNINIHGGTLISTADYTLYLPQEGTTTISNGTITGAAGAIGMRDGTLNITGGTLTSTGTGNTGQWSDGSSSMDNAVLNIGGGTTNTYGNCIINISGGEFIAQGNSVNIEKKASPKHTITLSFTGGTFNDPSALAYLSESANDVIVRLDKDLTLTESMVIRQGSAVIDLNQHFLTATAAAVVEGTTHVNQSVAIYVDTDAEVTVKNGKIGESTIRLFYGIFGKGNAIVNLENVEFSEMLSYAYNGAGSLLNADNCTFHGWISGWGNGTATFYGCTFTIGKAWYPAAICYGNTTFTSCKFFKNENDADVLGAQGANDENGYYNYSYVVAIANPATTIDFNTCSFIDESGAETPITVDNHPYHACGDWGDGKLPEVSQIQVDGQDVTTQCHGFTESSTEGGETTEGTIEE